MPRSTSAQVPSTKTSRRGSQEQTAPVINTIAPATQLPTTLVPSEILVISPGTQRGLPGGTQVAMRHGVGPPGGRQALSMQPGHIRMLFLLL